MSRVLDSDDDEIQNATQNSDEIAELSSPPIQKSSSRVIVSDDDDEENIADDQPSPASPDAETPTQFFRAENESADEESEKVAIAGDSTQFFRAENESADADSGEIAVAGNSTQFFRTENESADAESEKVIGTQFFRADNESADAESGKIVGTQFFHAEKESGGEESEKVAATQFFRAENESADEESEKIAVAGDSTQFFSTTINEEDEEKVEGHVTEEDLIEEAAGKDDAEKDEDADEDEEKRSEVGELIADIFGESDQEENAETENQEGEEVEAGPANQEDEQEQEEENLDRKLHEQQEDFVSDFDLMMEKRQKKSQKWRRRKKDYEFISYNDDMINELLNQMKIAAKEDLDLNAMSMPATRKRALLPAVLREIRKADLVSGFIEAGVVSVMAQWLSPLPDKSLPALEIRTEFLKILQTFPTLDHQILRSSNIGKAVMLLFKHPKELKENKERAQKLISEWARPIFNLQTDYRSLSKDERLKRDFDHMPSTKKRRLSMENEAAGKKTQQEESSKPVLGPGDKGFIGRARVPRPSTRDYVVRPKWNVETEIRDLKNKKHTESKMDKKIREIKMRTTSKKTLHAVGVSLEGRKIAI